MTDWTDVTRVWFETDTLKIVLRDGRLIVIPMATVLAAPTMGGALVIAQNALSEFARKGPVGGFEGLHHLQAALFAVDRALIEARGDE